MPPAPRARWLSLVRGAGPRLWLSIRLNEPVGGSYGARRWHSVPIRSRTPGGGGAGAAVGGWSMKRPPERRVLRGTTGGRASGCECVRKPATCRGLLYPADSVPNDLTSRGPLGAGAPPIHPECWHPVARRRPSGLCPPAASVKPSPTPSGTVAHLSGNPIRTGARGLTQELSMPKTSTGTRQVSGGGGSRVAGRRHGDLELWRDVNKTIIGLTSVVQIFANACAAPTASSSPKRGSTTPTSWQPGRNAKPTRWPSPGWKAGPKGGGKPPRDCGPVASKAVIYDRGWVPTRSASADLDARHPDHLGNCAGRLSSGLLVLRPASSLSEATQPPRSSRRARRRLGRRR
jgi:hypothetical protein